MKLLAVLVLTCGIATTKAASPHPLMLGFMYPRGVNGPGGTNSIVNSGTSGNLSKNAQALGKSFSKGETNGFRANLYLTTNQVFGVRTNASGLPHFTSFSRVKRGVWFYPAVVFASPGVESDGKALVHLSLTVRKPDGSICNSLEGIVVTKDPFEPSDKTFHLARDTQCVCIDEDEPVGTYTAEAVVRDDVKKTDVNLRMQFLVEK